MACDSWLHQWSFKGWQTSRAKTCHQKSQKSTEIWLVTPLYNNYTICKKKHSFLSFVSAKENLYPSSRIYKSRSPSLKLCSTFLSIFSIICFLICIDVYHVQMCLWRMNATRTRSPSSIHHFLRARHLVNQYLLSDMMVSNNARWTIRNRVFLNL